MITQTIDEKYRNEYFWTGKLQLELFRLIKAHMEDANLSQNQFASELGVSKSYMSQVLNGNFDHKLSKLVSLALAIGKVPRIEYDDLDAVIRRARGDYEPLQPAYVSKTQRVAIDKNSSRLGELLNSTADSSITFNEVA